MIRSVSKARAKQLAIYRPLARKFLADHPRCYACPWPSTDCHHSRGRQGSLLLAAEFWRAVCRVCHDRVKADPTWARAHDLLPPIGQWNSTPRTHNNLKENR